MVKKSPTVSSLETSGEGIYRQAEIYEWPVIKNLSFAYFFKLFIITHAFFVCLFFCLFVLFF